MKYKENLRPYGRLLNRYFLSLQLIKEISKGLNRESWIVSQQKIFGSLLNSASEYEIIQRLKEMEKSFFHCEDTFKRYLKKFYGISKLPK